MCAEFKEAAEEVKKLLKEKGAEILKSAVESVTRERIECEEGKEALRHFMSHWHDLVRPSLVALACEAVGGDPSTVAPIGKALTLLSGSTDLHDDMIDRSLTKRRGDTVLGRFGDNIALWAGDALTFKGHAELFEGLMRLDIPRERKLTIVRLVKDLYFEMGDGEILELKFRARPDVKPEEYLHVVQKKAADIEVCMRVGAILGGGSEEQVNRLGEYGRLLGTIVFLRDDFEDILDVDKGLNMRIKNESLPLPLLYALEDSERKREILTILKGEVKGEKAERLLKLVSEARGIERLWELFDELKSQGKQKTVGLKHQEIFDAILDATVPPPPK
jgi:geranylgeranyl diphosphate synthase type I